MARRSPQRARCAAGIVARRRGEDARPAASGGSVSEPCVPSSSATRTPSSSATAANTRSGRRACFRSGAAWSTASPARSAAALSFALAARLVESKAPVFAVLGDGTIGFHIAEFETAVRRGLPFVAILGNDARWNAESEIQRRDYGANRMHGCELLPVRYDRGRDGARRARRICRARRRPSRGDRTRTRQRQAGMRERDDREHRRSRVALAALNSGPSPTTTLRRPLWCSNGRKDRRR